LCGYLFDKVFSLLIYSPHQVCLCEQWLHRQPNKMPLVLYTNQQLLKPKLIVLVRTAYLLPLFAQMIHHTASKSEY